jgi:hypothetical protein
MTGGLPLLFVFIIVIIFFNSITTYWFALSCAQWQCPRHTSWEFTKELGFNYVYAWGNTVDYLYSPDLFLGKYFDVEG